MAHRGGKKTTGISRDAQPKKLGVKLFAGEKSKKGSVIVRQRGTSFYPGKNVRKGKDHTLYAAQEGIVRYRTKKIIGFDGRKKVKRIVEIF